jgi:hypothetical protein
MTDESWRFFALLGVASLLVVSAVYALIYALIGRFIVGEPVNWTRSYFATLAGLPLAMGVLGIGSSAVFYRFVDREIGTPIILASWPLIMTAMNVLIMRKDSGGQLSFIQAFLMQLVPNALFLTYSLLTRPSAA